jgi:hypothetical protein
MALVLNGRTTDGQDSAENEKRRNVFGRFDQSLWFGRPIADNALFDRPTRAVRSVAPVLTFCLFACLLDRPVNRVVIRSVIS